MRVNPLFLKASVPLVASLLQSSPDVGDAAARIWVNGDGVALVAAEAKDHIAFEPIKKTDMIPAGASHDDGIPFLPCGGVGDVHRLPPGGPARGAVVLTRDTGASGKANGPAKTSAPGRGGVVSIKPLGGLLDPCPDLGVTGLPFYLGGAEVF